MAYKEVWWHPESNVKTETYDNSCSTVNIPVEFNGWTRTQTSSSNLSVVETGKLKLKSMKKTNKTKNNITQKTVTLEDCLSDKWLEFEEQEKQAEKFVITKMEKNKKSILHVLINLLSRVF
ncbi:MAG: hypothetical protein LLG05_14650 [Porphyromonadaceae bacterium]|nr:hypothetical protein [Porphyromonadaceae bacterium]